MLLVMHISLISLQSCFLPSPCHPHTGVNLSQNLRVNSAVMSTRHRAATTIGGVFDRPGQVALLAKPRLERPQCSPPAPGLDSLSANHDKSPPLFSRHGTIPTSHGCFGRPINLTPHQNNFNTPSSPPLHPLIPHSPLHGNMTRPPNPLPALSTARRLHRHATLPNSELPPISNPPTHSSTQSGQGI